MAIVTSSFFMNSILTLSVGAFELIHDILSFSIVAMGAAALFFFFSQQQMIKRRRPLLLLAAIVALIGCYDAWRLLSSWNELFELAGNSYAASGHFFHETYRYSDWLLTMPLLLLELVMVLALSADQTRRILQRLIGAALVMTLFAYLGASHLVAQRPLVHWSCWLLEAASFLYIASLLVRELSREAMQQPAPVDRLFLKARNLFLLSFAFYPLASLVALCNNGFGEYGLVTFLLAAAIADLTSKCGVSFYVYRMALMAEETDNSL
jgi:bacteriorhodopsin